MAFSPPPQSSSVAGPSHAGPSNLFYRAERLSPSPSAQQSINKRDKKRLALQDRLSEIINTFAGHRDVYYRKQLQQYQADINHITNAPLYDNKALPEPGEEGQDLVSVRGGASYRQALHGLTNGNAKSDSTTKLGRHGAKFVHDVNDALEQRDADLVNLAYRHNFAIHQLDKDYKFAVEVAERESQRLVETLRNRLIQNVNQRISALQREKERLDNSDTNALLHHPTQFSISNVASPGGPQSNRKTRHTRYRHEGEEVDQSINNSGTSGKRKRKTAQENDNGSPGPSTNRESEQLVGNVLKDTSFRSGATTVPAVYSADRLFSDREITTTLQQATYDVIQSRATSSTHQKRRKLHVPRLTANPDSLLPTNAEPTDVEDDISVNQEAPPIIIGADGIGESFAGVAMDRTPSQLYHATRSAGRLQPAASAQNTLGELAGRQSAADLIGTYGRGHDRTKRDGDDYQRAPPLSDQEALDDVRMMEAAIKREDAEEEDAEDEDDENDNGSVLGFLGGRGGRGGRKLLDMLLADEQVDYVGPPGFAEAVDHGNG